MQYPLLGGEWNSSPIGRKFKRITRQTRTTTTTTSKSHTTDRSPSRGAAASSNKDLGYFWIGVQGSREIVLCESAIDAISCFQLYPERICISTSGVRANPPWLRALIDHGYALFCGFDADDPGDAGAAAMLAHHPAVHRLRPSAHDWNDVLTSRN